MARQQRRRTVPERAGATADDHQVATTGHDEQTADQAVRARAHELYEQRGGEHGHDWEDWLQAERELRDAGTGE